VTQPLATVDVKHDDEGGTVLVSGEVLRLTHLPGPGTELVLKGHFLKAHSPGG
jgi:hypothetical protein